jgi:hypothetical protein
MLVPLYSENTSFLSWMLPIWGLIAAFTITFLCRRKRWAMAIGPVLMFAVHFAAQNVTATEGPAACVSALALPPVRSARLVGYPEGDKAPGSEQENLMQVRLLD